MLERILRKRSPPLLLVNCSLMRSSWRTVWRLINKREAKLLSDPAISFLGVYLEKTTIEKDTHTPISRSAVYNSQDMEATSMSINRWMDEEAVVHKYDGISFSHKKEQIWVSWTEMDDPRACYTEWTMSLREKQISYINTYVESRKMVLMNLFAGQE